MKRNFPYRYKILLSACLSAALAFGPAGYAYGDQAVITPLEESSVAQMGSEASQGPSGGSGTVGGGGAQSQGPSGTGGPAGTGSPAGGGNPSGTGSTSGTDSPSGNGSSSGGTASSSGTAGSGEGQSESVQEPVIAAEGAVVIEASTGKVLFAKNAETKYYPASITKLMTALLVAENCNLDDTVTFSATATTNLEAGAVSLNLTEGDKLTVRQCLYALLLKSANEVGNALAEHVAGSNAKFADMMNAKAAALGCTNTHFTNPHGLNDANHYTTPHDMALIARAAFENGTVRTVASTLSYQLPATKKNAARTITMGHKMLNPSDSRYYPGMIGGKTGYTSKAGNTLVTAVEQDGVRLIAVVMKSKSTHYTDTKALLDYGFAVLKQQNSSGTDGSGAAGPGGGGSGTGSGTGGVSGGGSGTGTGTGGGPGASQAAGWQQDGNGWYYVKSDGTRAASQWLELGGETYWFDSNAYMANGWRQFDNGAWYYFRSSGAMAKNYWVETNGQYFYLGGDGVMLKDTVTPDGYRVDGNGVWVQ